MREIKLIPRDLRKPILFALVDDEDYEMLNQYEWGYHAPHKNLCYAFTHINGKTINMQSLVLPSDNKNLVRDHINGNCLDNRKENLRLIRQQQNVMNSKKHADGSSKYKGVNWCAANQKWMAKIHINGKSQYIGYFKFEKAAAYAYNRKALELFGEFAYLNKIED